MQSKFLSNQKVLSQWDRIMSCGSSLFFGSRQITVTALSVQVCTGKIYFPSCSFILTFISFSCSIYQQVFDSVSLISFSKSYNFIITMKQINFLTCFDFPFSLFRHFMQLVYFTVQVFNSLGIRFILFLLIFY